MHKYKRILLFSCNEDLFLLQPTYLTLGCVLTEMVWCYSF